MLYPESYAGSDLLLYQGVITDRLSFGSFCCRVERPGVPLRRSNSEADASFFKKLRKAMNSIKKTHWLVLLGDYNARRKAWGDSDNGRGKMLEGLATKLGMICSIPG